MYVFFFLVQNYWKSLQSIFFIILNLFIFLFSFLVYYEKKN